MAMGPDGTTVYYGLTDTGNFHYRDVVQIRRPGGPLGPVQYLSTDGVTPSFPTVVAGPDGRFAAAWIEGGVLETAFLDPGATTFDAPSPVLTSGDTPGNTPAIALDGSGNLLVLLSSTSGSPPNQTTYVRFAVRPPTTGAVGSTVLDSLSGSQSTMVGTYGLTLRAADSGAAIAGWDISTVNTGGSDTTTSDNLKVALRPAGQAFGTPTSLAIGSYGTPYGSQVYLGWPVVAMTPDGHGGVAWSSRTDNGGGTTSSVVRFRDATPGSALGSVLEPSGTSTTTQFMSPRVAMGPDGRTFVSWLAPTGGVTRPTVAVRAAGAASFGTSQPLGTGSDNTSYYDLEVSRSGGALALWSPYSTSTGLSTVQAALAPAGGFFGAQQQLAGGLTSLSPGAQGALTAAGDGVALVRSVNKATSHYESFAIGLDGSGPRLTGLSIPGSATTGDVLAFGVTPVDVWSAVTTHWDFGDGASADGASASHAYANAGNPTVTVTATDAVGNATTATGTVAVSTPPAGGGGGVGGSGSVVTDTTPPAVGAVSLTNSSFAVARTPTAIAAAAHRKLKRGTVIGFTLTEPGVVTLTFQRRAAGLRSGKRCVAPTRRLRKHHPRACTRWVRAGALTRNEPAGAAKVPFSGRIGTRALKPGAWRVVVRAADAAGNRSKPGIRRFRILRG